MDPKKLDVFKLSHELVLRIYDITKAYPREEKFGLTSQMRRAASSIPTNMMEGSGRKSTKEYIHFLSISSGSCEEIKYQLLLSRDLGYIEKATYDDLVKEYSRVSKMLFRLGESLENKI
jgi:four helix bundle protein